MADVEDAEAAQAVDVRASGQRRDTSSVRHPPTRPPRPRAVASVALRYSRNPGLTWSRNDSTVSCAIHAACAGVISVFSISSKTRFV